MASKSRVLSVLIVDDERATREGLARNIPWDDLGIDVVGLAEDGQAALALVAEHRPDIVLTDVRMPRMDGIALAAEIRRRYPSTEVLFLSGYSDREYLLSAIKLRAFDYVEKPVSLDELTAILRNLRDKLERDRNEREAARDHVLSILLDDPTADEARDAVAAAGLPEDAVRHAAVAVARLHPASRSTSGGSASPDAASRVPEIVASGRIGDDVIALISSDARGAGIASAADALLQELAGASGEPREWVVGVGPPVEHPHLLRTSLEGARQALGRAFLRGWGRAYTYRRSVSPDLHVPELDLDAVRSSLEADDCDAALRVLRGWRDSLRLQPAAREEPVREAYSRILIIAEEIALRKHLSIDEIGTLHDASGLREAATLDEAHAIAREAILSLYLPAAEFSRTRRLVFEVEQHLRRSFTKVPTLGEVAARFKVSTPHLSRVFRGATDMRFTDFVKRVKVEQAKELLRDITLRVSEIADQLGYDDRRYFSRVFKQVTGMSPRDYREKYL